MDELSISHLKVKNNHSLGANETVYFIGYNIQGEKQETKTIKLMKDKNSLNNSLRNKRYKSNNWSGVLSSDNVPLISLTGTEITTTTSKVKIINSNGDKYVFNNATTYNSSAIWLLSAGTYTINVPQSHPMAILNNGKTDTITYDGDSAKQSTKSVTGTTADGTYFFYYGDITINVLGNFGTISIYCFHHGYMGEKNLIKFNLSENNILNSSNKFQDDVALHKNELLLYNGIYTNDASYYVDYRNTYNLQVDGSHLGDNDSKSNISWKDENNNDIDFKWALFRFNNTIQSAGTAKFKIRFHTPSSSSFTNNSNVEDNTKFQCNIRLPSTRNNGDMYWYNVNAAFESENSRATGRGSDGVTNLGIFDSKSRTSSYTDFIVTPPVPTANTYFE